MDMTYNPKLFCGRPGNSGKRSHIFRKLICLARGEAFVFAAAALLVSAFSEGAAAAPLRFALIENEPTEVTLQLVQAIERVLREAGADATLDSVDELPCSFAGPDYYLRLSTGAAPSGTAVLESDSEIIFVYPPVASLIAALKKAAANPATFRMPDSRPLNESQAETDVGTTPDPEASVIAHAKLYHPVSGRLRTGLAAYYRLHWKGGDVTIVMVGRSYGGIGRLSAAAAQEAAKGPLIGLARGGTFGADDSDARGRAALEMLERAGLKFSAVSASEIENWPALEAYRRERPAGIQYLSANLVFSTASERTILPPYAVFSVPGARVAVVGLTPAWAGRLLKPAKLADFKIEEPVAAVKALIPRLRAEADIVIVLSPLDATDNARLATTTRGLDLIFADDAPFLTFTPPPASAFEQSGRQQFANTLPPVYAYWPALNIVEVERRADGDRVMWKMAQSARLLDDEVELAADSPEPALKFLEVARSTDVPILPSAREVFPQSERAGLPVYESRDFWTLAAAVLAWRARAEAALLPAPGLQTPTVGAVRESFVRQWLGPADEAVLAHIPGSQLKSLFDEAAGQKKREAAGQPSGGRIRMAISGFDSEKGLVSGVPFNEKDTYLLATSRSAAEALGLPAPYAPLRDAPTVAAAVIDGLRALSGTATLADWRSWMTGKPVSEHGLWRVNFRDIGLNLRQVGVDRPAGFDQVPNSRIQGFNELTIGGTLKTDVEYLRSEYKWTTTLEMDYAKDRLSPRNAPTITNLAANRIMLLTLATRRVGGTPYGWLAGAWGPSLGLQADGEFQAVPGLRRKQVYSVFPGVEFYDGSVVKTLELTADIKRDLSRDPPNTQTGLRVRALVSAPFGPGGAKLEGEFWNNYFFSAHGDSPTDLRVEGDANARLSIPVHRHLSIAPFVDLYWFSLKTRPLWGYSLMTGVSLRFSRLWKPQYE